MKYDLNNPHPDYKEKTDAIGVAFTGYAELCKACQNKCKNAGILVCNKFKPKEPKQAKNNDNKK